jgi:hypothetical protein
VDVYTVASAKGVVAAAAFFLAFAAMVALVCYGLLTRPWTRRIGVGGSAARSSTAALAAAGVGLVLFATIFLTTLAGFHAVAVEAESVRLDYAVPPRSVVLPRGDIRLVTAKPAYKGQWQLEITTSTGRYSSAVGSADAVKQAAAGLAPR